MASYYPIKCPYCLKSHTNETVRFNIKDAVVTSSKTAKTTKKSLDSSFEKTTDLFDASVDFTELDDEQPLFSAGNKKSGRAIPKDGYYTLSELKEIFGAENIKIQEKTIYAMPALTSEEYDGSLLMAVTFTVTEDGKEIERTMKLTSE